MSGVAGLVIAQVSHSHAESVVLTDQVQARCQQIYGGPDIAPVDNDEFATPRGAFFVAYEAGVPPGWPAALRPGGGRPMTPPPARTIRGSRGHGCSGGDEPTDSAVSDSAVSDSAVSDSAVSDSAVSEQGRSVIV